MPGSTGKITRIILERLGDTAVGIGDLMAAFIATPHGDLRGLRRNLEERARIRENRKIDRQQALERRQQFYDLCYRLRKSGFVQEETRNGEAFLALSRAGEEKLKLLREQAVLPIPRYTTKKGKQTIIISFDIPERERRKRKWLRAALRVMGFKQLQQSLWIGLVQLPSEFLEDIAYLGLVNFVEIFAVTRSGTIQNLVK